MSTCEKWAIRGEAGGPVFPNTIRPTRSESIKAFMDNQIAATAKCRVCGPRWRTWAAAKRALGVVCARIASTPD